MKKVLIAAALATLAACSGAKKTDAAPAASDSSMMSHDSSMMMSHDSSMKQ